MSPLLLRKVASLSLLGSCTLGLRHREGSSHTEEPESFVEVLAGTDTTDGGAESDGNVLPQLKRPHGMNDWAPLTNPGGGSWWFRRADTDFHGMRLTHQPSPWIGDYATLFVQPHTTEESTALKYDAEASEFRPHHFKTQLKADGQLRSKPIDFEFTATSRAAMLRVGFDKAAKQRRVTLNVGDGTVEFKNGQLQGQARKITHTAPKGWQGLFFVARPVAAVATDGRATDAGVGTLSFETQEPVSLAIGTSFISHEQAERNLEKEIGARTFDEVVEENRKAWRSVLSRVQVEALDKERLSEFYTNLWRSMLFPRNLHELNAEGKEEHYSPYAGKVMPGRLVADSGFWDSYRTVYTLKSIVAPEQYSRLISGWLSAYDEAKWLPQWASPDQQNSMVGSMGDFVLADAIAKSKWGVLDGVDTAKAYEAIRKDAFVERESLYGREGLKDYIKTGYVPDSDSDESVTESQGYWLADAAISEAAKLLGKTEDAEVLAKRSMGYKSLFNKETMFFQPKDASGKFEGSFDPLAWRNGFTEGGAWQYRFDVPQDVEGLNTLFNGNLCGKIGEMMQKTSGEYFHVGGYGQVIHEMREAQAIQKDFGLYAHSNQPVHHILWIAKKAGCDEIGDQYLRKVMRKLYTKKGWAGDEDNGEMASWYVLASLGVFQLEGAKDELVLGSPSVVRGTVALPKGRSLVVATENQSDENVYVQKVTWEPTGSAKRELSENILKYTALMQGGVLTFSMGAAPKPHQGPRKDTPIEFHSMAPTV